MLLLLLQLLLQLQQLLSLSMQVRIPNMSMFFRFETRKKNQKEFNALDQFVKVFFLLVFSFHFVVVISWHFIFIINCFLINLSEPLLFKLWSFCSSRRRYSWPFQRQKERTEKKLNKITIGRVLTENYF